MLFTQDILEGIAAGRVTLAFRRWTRASVRAGGTLLTPVGQLRIRAVDPISLAAITDPDARRAGAKSAEDLRVALRQRPDGQFFRIEFDLAGPDPRRELRDRTTLTDDERAALGEELSALDRGSRSGPWTLGLLRLLQRRPAVRAAELADELGMERLAFKRRVRLLKGLGFTESLGTGYRLSRRGIVALNALGSDRAR